MHRETCEQLHSEVFRTWCKLQVTIVVVVVVVSVVLGARSSILRTKIYSAKLVFVQAASTHLPHVYLFITG